MIRLSYLFFLALLVGACAEPAEPTSDTAPDAPFTENDQLVAEVGLVVGEDPGDGVVVFANDVVDNPEEYDGLPVRVAGTVSEVCQMKGCWLSFQNDAGTPFRVMVAQSDGDYVFDFPKDIAGQSAVVAGTLTLEETSVETRRHLARDKKASDEEIAAITEPERTIILTASGARIEGA